MSPTRDLVVGFALVTLCAVIIGLALGSAVIITKMEKNCAADRAALMDYKIENVLTADALKRLKGLFQ